MATVNIAPGSGDEESFVEDGDDVVDEDDVVLVLENHTPDNSAQKVYADTVKTLFADVEDTFTADSSELVGQLDTMNKHRNGLLPSWLAEAGNFEGILSSGPDMLKKEKTRIGLAAMTDISVAVIDALVFCKKSILMGEGHEDLTCSMQKVFGKLIVM